MILFYTYYALRYERIENVLIIHITAVVRWLLGPDLHMMHEFRASLPEECTFGMERCFNIPRYTYTLPTMEPFSEWLYHRSRQSIKEMYSYQRKTLQMIGYKGTCYLCVSNNLRMIGYKGKCNMCELNAADDEL